MKALLILLTLASTAQAGYPYKCYVYPAYVAPVVAVPAVTEKDWRGKVIDALYAKDKLAKESADYALALQALGSPAAAAYAPVAAQGATTYGEFTRGGYSANPLQAYQQTNLETLFALSNRQVENAQNLSGQAQQGFLQAVKLTADGNERVASILAKVELLKAAEPPEFKRIGSETRTQSGVSGQSATVYGNAGPQAAQQKLAAVIANRCTSCHNEKESQGGLNMQNFFNFDAATKAAVRKAITESDPAKRMPLAREGGGFGPGTPLEFSELVMFAN